MTICMIDFETRSTQLLGGQKSVGAYRYAMDPSTEVICCAFKVDDGPTRIAVNRDIITNPKRHGLLDALIRYKNIPEAPMDEFLAVVYAADEVHAFNANFERCIWTHVMVKKYGCQEIPVEKWHCTQARAAAAGCPLSLAKAGHALRLPVLKQERGSLLIQRLCKPKQNGEWNENVVDLVDMYQYCVQDVEAEYAIHGATEPLLPQEQAVWVIDQKMNDRGTHVDLEVAHAVLDMVEAEKKELNSELKSMGLEVTLHKIDEGTGAEQPYQAKITSFTQGQRIIPWLIENGCDVPLKLNDKKEWVPSLAKEQRAEILARENLPPLARRVLEIVDAGTKTSAAKFNTMLRCASLTDYLHGMYEYHGAHTGRWAGRMVQPQNLPRDSFKPSEVDDIMQLYRTKGPTAVSEKYDLVLHMASKMIRGTLIAPEDHQFLVADYGQIEARGVAWLAQEEWKLKAFREADAGRTRDIYCITYANAFGINADDVDDYQRHLGKTMELAFGYQGSTGAWAKMSIGAAADLPEEEVEGLVERWRNSHRAIVDLWDNIDDCAKKATQNHGEPFGYSYVTFYHDGTVLWCSLPSGRRIAYRDAYIKAKENKRRDGTTWTSEQVHFMGLNDKKQWVEKHSYGGKWVENIVQALCRDLMAEAMVRTEETHPPVITVHDELGTYIPCDRVTETTVKEYEDLLSIVPDWAEGFPLVAEGWVGKRYRK